MGYFTLLLKTGNAPISLSEFPAQLLAIQFNHDYRLNGVFWTLGLEIQFYLLAPILTLSLHVSSTRLHWVMRSIPYCLLYVAALMIIHYLTRHFGWSYDGRNILMVLPHFLAGLIGCRFVVDSPPVIWRAWAALGGAILLLLAANLIYHGLPDIFWSIKGILIVDAMIILLIVAHAGLERLSKLRPGPISRSLEWLGTVSYGIYAWHAYFIESFGMEGKLIMLIGITLLASYFSYRFIELPALRLKR